MERAVSGLRDLLVGEEELVFIGISWLLSGVPKFSSCFFVKKRASLWSSSPSGDVTTCKSGLSEGKRINTGLTRIKLEGLRFCRFARSSAEGFAAARIC